MEVRREDLAKIDELVSVRPLGGELLTAVQILWTKSFAGTIQGMGLCNYKRWMRSVMERVLSRAVVFGVVDEQSPQWIYGWACFEWLGEDLPVVHYAYIKRDWRHKYGMLERMANAAGITRRTALIYTFKTNPGEYLARNHQAPAQYIPIERFLEEHR